MKPSRSLPHVCEHCASPFLGRADRRFCSKRCNLARRVSEMCALATTPAAKEKSKETRTRRSRKVGYLKRQGRHVHRSVAEAMLGRPLARGEIVHHVDGDKRNNAPSNLRVMTQAEHMREHGLGTPGMTLHWKPWTKRWRKRA